MAMKVLKLRCYHPDCANDPLLEIRVELPRISPASNETKEKQVQCERGHYNIITIPANWSVQEPVLGDVGVLGDQDGVPIVQGKVR